MLIISMSLLTAAINRCETVKNHRTKYFKIENNYYSLLIYD